MPQTKFQDVVYTIIMVCIMVYAMVCYNVAIDMGGLSNEVFLIALHELPIMGTIGFILEFFIIGNLAKKLAFRFVDPAKDRPIVMILSISAMIVCLMCPVMSKRSLQLQWRFQHHCQLVEDYCCEFSNGNVLPDILCWSFCQTDL